MNESPRVDAALIIGTGLIGTSLGLALGRRGVRVFLRDRDPQAVAIAASRGAGTGTGPSQPPDVVVVAAPPRVTLDLVRAALTQYPESTVMDVSSVKGQVVTDVEGADATRLVGSHPLAGREVSGPEAAEADLFLDRVWVLTPTGETSARALAVAREVVRLAGGIAIELDPLSHDRAVALTSHAPQVLASLMGARLLGALDEDLLLSGQGLRDVCRVAGSDSQLWEEILQANAGHVADVLDDVRTDLANVIAGLRGIDNHESDVDTSVDIATLRDVLVRGREGHRRIPGKHGVRTAAFDVVRVVVEDEPGALGRLFVAAGGAGINLEDVRIEHAFGRPTGLVELSVARDHADALRQALADQGHVLSGTRLPAGDPVGIDPAGNDAAGIETVGNATAGESE